MWEASMVDILLHSGRQSTLVTVSSRSRVIFAGAIEAASMLRKHLPEARHTKVYGLLPSSGSNAASDVLPTDGGYPGVYAGTADVQVHVAVVRAMGLDQ